jgi:hypothetical protein
MAEKTLWDIYLDEYLKPSFEYCKRKMPEAPQVCLEKTATPFYWWARERELIK